MVIDIVTLQMSHGSRKLLSVLQLREQQTQNREILCVACTWRLAITVMPLHTINFESEIAYELRSM